VERRAFHRVPLERACIIRRDHPTLAIWNGVVKNIGRGGALVSVESGGNGCLLPGEEVIVEMLLDENRAFEQRSMNGRGRVVRAERDGAAVHIGVEFVAINICPATENWIWTANKQVS
jgi:hypothetical protein